MKDIAFAVPFFFVCSKRFVLSEARGACRGAKRVAAACGRRRQAAEVKKQGALRRAKSEQGDYVSEGQSPLSPCHRKSLNLRQIELIKYFFPFGFKLCLFSSDTTSIYIAKTIYLLYNYFKL